MVLRSCVAANLHALRAFLARRYVLTCLAASYVPTIGVAEPAAIRGKGKYAAPARRLRRAKRVRATR